MKIFKIFFFITVLLSSNISFAGNIYGSDIFWKRLSNDTFQIRFEIYTDCSKPLDSINPEVFPVQCIPFVSIAFGKPISHTIINVTPHCHKERNKCETNPNQTYGINRNTFIYKIYMGINTNCCWYKISLKGLNRDDQISNGNSNTGFETSIELDKCLSTNLESTSFFNPPVNLKYKNLDIEYNHGVYQSSGDSISFALQNPVNATYIAPFSATYPFNCNGGNVIATTISPFMGFGINSSTGSISSRPTDNGYFIFSVKAFQWKKINGVYTLVGISNREMMYLVVNKPLNNAPTLSGPFFYETSPGQTICITVNSNDQDTGDATMIFWDNKLPGTFTSNNGSVKNASGTMCWTPSDVDESCFPYNFSVIAYDDHCLFSESTTKQYVILVRPTMRASQQYKRINCHTYQFLCKPSNRTGCLANIPYSIRWYEPKLIGTGSSTTLISNSDSTRYDFTKGGRYIVRVSFTANGIGNTYFDTLNVDTFSSVNIINMDSVISANDTVVLYAETNLSNGANNYEWWANGKLIGITSSIVVNPKVSTTYTIINKSLNSPCDITSDNLTLIISGTTGIKTNEILRNLIKTNPFKNELILFNDTYEFEELNLNSVDGKLIKSVSLKEGINKINTENLTSGIYILSLRKNDDWVQLKLIRE